MTPPASPESDVERGEEVDALRLDADRLEGARDPVQALVEEEESSAAAEAAAIGGPVPEDAGGDPAMEPVFQAGGGVAEGFELAEADLIENAEHRDAGANPLRDAFTPELESDRSTGVDAAGNRLVSTEVVADPDEDAGDDPGAGPGIAADRS